MKGSIRNPSFQEVCEAPSCYCTLFSNGLLWIAYRFLCIEHSWDLYNLKLLKLHRVYFPFVSLPTTSVTLNAYLRIFYNVFMTNHVHLFLLKCLSFCQLTSSKCDVLTSLQFPLTLSVLHISVRDDHGPCF